MRRREILGALAGLGLLPLVARAQANARRIGLLSPLSPTEDAYKAELLRGMRELGYAAGKDFVLVERYADGREAQLSALATELVELRVDLIFAPTLHAVRAAQQATASIPIVFVAVSDPVRLGFADSLAHPGRNLTGMSNFAGDLAPKRLELAKALLPGLARIALLVNPSNPLTGANISNARTAAERLGLQVLPVNVGTAEDLEPAFALIARERSEAVLVTGDVYHFRLREPIAAAAAKHRIASIFPFRECAEAGGVMSYGTDVAYQFRHAASYVDKILRGAKPGDLPVEQPAKFELVLNRHAAIAIGLAIPRELLLRADRVIE